MMQFVRFEWVAVEIVSLEMRSWISTNQAVKLEAMTADYVTKEGQVQDEKEGPRAEPWGKPWGERWGAMGDLQLLMQMNWCLSER